MSEVKTAAAWGRIIYDDIDDVNFLDNRCGSTPSGMPNCVPVTIVYGATESDILAGLSLLAKSREVCEYASSDFGRAEVYYPINHENQIPMFEVPHFCPVEGCGRRVEVKE